METTNLDSRQALIGSTFIVLAAIGFSSKSILIKLAYADSAQIDAITLMTLRMTLAFPFFLAVALWSRESVTSERRTRDWIALTLLVPRFTLFCGFSKTTSGQMLGARAQD